MDKGLKIKIGAGVAAAAAVAGGGAAIAADRFGSNVADYVRLRFIMRKPN